MIRSSALDVVSRYNYFDSMVMAEQDHSREGESEREKSGREGVR